MSEILLKIVIAAVANALENIGAPAHFSEQIIVIVT